MQTLGRCCNVLNYLEQFKLKLEGIFSKYFFARESEYVSGRLSFPPKITNISLMKESFSIGRFPRRENI